jgi:NADH-quinone oxidoreductase subunit J
MLVLNDLEFFGILLVIVYVGAILVLFLFVVMMLNVSKTEVWSTWYNYLLFGLLYIFILAFLILHSQQSKLDEKGLLVYYFFNIMFINFFYELSGIFTSEILGLLMFTYYCPTFIIVTTILFISMFGSIALVYVKPLYLCKGVKSFKAMEKPIDFSISLEQFIKCIY